MNFYTWITYTHTTAKVCATCAVLIFNSFEDEGKVLFLYACIKDALYLALTASLHKLFAFHIRFQLARCYIHYQGKGAPFHAGNSPTKTKNSLAQRRQNSAFMPKKIIRSQRRKSLLMSTYLEVPVFSVAARTVRLLLSAWCGERLQDLRGGPRQRRPPPPPHCARPVCSALGRWCGVRSSCVFVCVLLSRTNLTAYVLRTPKQPSVKKQLNTLFAIQLAKWVLIAVNEGTISQKCNEI